MLVLISQNSFSSLLVWSLLIVNNYLGLSANTRFLCVCVSWFCYWILLVSCCGWSFFSSVYPCNVEQKPATLWTLSQLLLLRGSLLLSLPITGREKFCTSERSNKVRDTKHHCCWLEIDGGGMQGSSIHHWTISSDYHFFFHSHHEWAFQKKIKYRKIFCHEKFTNAWGWMKWRFIHYWIFLGHITVNDIKLDILP